MGNLSRASLLLFAGILVAAPLTAPGETGRQGITPEEIMAARTPVFVKEDLERFISIFPTAGSDSVVWISDYFCEFALVNPKTFFSVMGEHSALFDSWLKTIDETSFTDMGGCLDRECFRERMVTLLETIQWAGGLEDAKSRAMLKRLLDRVKEVKVRHSPV